MKLLHGLLCAAVVMACSKDKGSATGPSEEHLPPPNVTVSSVSPDSGPLAGGTAVTITGTHFPATVDSVRVGTGRLASLQWVSSTQLTGTTPAGAAGGAVNVVVYTTTAGVGSCVGCFSYASPPPQTAFPSVLGTTWLYSDSSNGSFCDSYGCGSSARRDTILLVLDSAVAVGGRSALQLRGFPLNNGMVVTTTYLSQDATGLAKWDGSTWKTLLPASALSWTSDRCWSMGYSKSGTVSRSTAQVTVPAGTYATAHTSWSYQYTSQYTSESTFESCSDYYADGVGLVRSTHNYDYHDVATTSSGQHGQLNLLAVNSTAPAYAAEAEPNDTTTTAQVVTLGTAGILIEGSATPGDAAALPADTMVGRDTTGVRRIQDWYRVDLASGRKLTLTLQPEDANADFDLYVLSGSPLKVVASSLNAAGKRESVTVMATSAATAYVGVQFWNLKTGTHWYWLYAR